MNYSKPIEIYGNKTGNGKLYRISRIMVTNASGTESRALYQLSVFDENLGDYSTVYDISRGDFKSLQEAQEYVKEMY